MNHMKQQHLISLMFLGTMAMWIGGAAALCGFTGMGAGIPPSIVVERAAPVGEISPDEHHEDRYLDWGASSRLRIPATPRG